MRFLCTAHKSVSADVPGYLKRFVGGIVLVLLFGACAEMETVPQNEIKSRYADQTPEHALQLTARRYEEAASENYDYFSPENWKLATEALTKAKDIAAQNKNNQEIFKQIILVDRRIDSAKYIKDRISKEFADLFEYNRILQKNNAPVTFKTEYETHTKALSSLLKAYEKFTLGSATEAENIRTINIDALKLVKAMQALNIKAVKHNYLSHDILRMKQLEASEARNIAPISVAQAESALKLANEYIENNVHNPEGVKIAADKFSFSVSHLEHVINEVVELSKLDLHKLERVVLNQEQYLLQIGQALNGIDVRNLPLSIQADSVIKTATNVLDHHAEKSSMIVELSEKNLLLEKQLSKLADNDDGTHAKLKSKIKLLELDIQALEEEREKLKEDLFALQQKNIDLAIQNAKLLADMEHKQSNFKSGDKRNLSATTENDSKAIIKTSTKNQPSRRDQARLSE